MCLQVLNALRPAQKVGLAPSVLHEFLNWTIPLGYNLPFVMESGTERYSWFMPADQVEGGAAILRLGRTPRTPPFMAARDGAAT